LCCASSRWSIMSFSTFWVSRQLSQFIQFIWALHRMSRCTLNETALKLSAWRLTSCPGKTWQLIWESKFWIPSCRKKKICTELRGCGPFSVMIIGSYEFVHLPKVYYSAKIECTSRYSKVSPMTVFIQALTVTWTGVRILIYGNNKDSFVSVLLLLQQPILPWFLCTF